MTGEHTPDEFAVRGAYNYARGASADSDAVLDAEFDRFIARIKAEALRSAAEVLRGSGQADEMVMVVGEEEDEESWVDLTIDEWLRNRADQIEKEGL